jgi:beta-phosphoglucomutase-like phosphatase (HAD superfamily)
MNTSALIMMVATQLTVASFTGYFFYKVLTTKPKPEPDSFLENDEKVRDKSPEN